MKSPQAVNVSTKERWISLLVGTGIVFVTLVRSMRSIFWLLLGGFLAYRGLTGRCPLYAKLGGGRAREGRQRGPSIVPRPIRLQHALTINRPVQAVFDHFAEAEEIPGHVKMIQSVRPLGDGRAEWTLVLPGPVPVTFRVRSERVETREDRSIVWRSTPDSKIAFTERLDVREAPGGRGTEMNLSVEYHPPNELVATPVRWLLESVVAAQMAEEMRRVKSVLEAGEAPTAASQPAGPGAFERGGEEPSVTRLLARGVRKAAL